ncbi:hypothetical protein ACH41E_09240 [Streptomyces sp. NPDC020412]|uniref:hypothetical protein n=1 Tax=Streptomyces sp. NPDC020412 TaxID=3365073 RepID=UPI0037B2BCAF
MRDHIVQALVRVLTLLIPRTRPGRHTAEYLAARSAPGPASRPVSPWNRPWPGPTKEQAQAFLLQQQRRRVLYYATEGVDIPYTYPGAPFAADAFPLTEAAA